MWTSGSKGDEMDYYYFFEHEVNVQKLKWRGSQGIGLCPLPAHDDTHPSFSCCGETGLWNCFGCGEKGNAYLLALETNMRNPRQYIDDSTTYSKHYTTNGYEPKITLKGEDKESDEAEIVQKYEDLKKKYGDRVTLGHQYKDKYVGKDDNGETVFIYPNGIKVHKKYWVKNASSDTSNQIFMVDELDGFDKTKPLYIFEGEKDALISPLQGISFSSGCSAIPKNIKVIYALVASS